MVWILVILGALALLGFVVSKARGRKPGLGERAVLAASAPGWRAADEDLSQEERAKGAYRMWRHSKGHEVRVFFLQPPPEFSPEEFLMKMFLEMEVAGPFVEGGLSGVRFLQNLECANEDHAHDGVVTTINYAVFGGGGIHLVSTVVPWAEQQKADRRMILLLQCAGWEPAPLPRAE